VYKNFIGATDPKAGAAGSCVDLLSETCFNHQVEVSGGIMEEKCAYVVQEFFRRLRSGEKKNEFQAEPVEGCSPGQE
jgi:tRNA(adenine34) deaminase